MLAKRVAQRRFALAGPRLWEPNAALEELPICIDERHQGDRNVQQAADQAGDAVERCISGRIEQAGRS